MTLVERAQEIRNRLRNPPNAVHDTGINLKRREEPAPVAAPIEVKSEAPRIEHIPVPEHSVDRVLNAVARYYGYKLAEMLHPLHTRPFVRVRSIAAYIARRCTKASLPNIGQRMGGRDHSFVISNMALVAKRVQSDECFAAEVAAVEKMVCLKLGLSPH